MSRAALPISRVMGSHARAALIARASAAADAAFAPATRAAMPAARAAMPAARAAMPAARAAVAAALVVVLLATLGLVMCTPIARADAPAGAAPAAPDAPAATAGSTPPAAPASPARAAAPAAPRSMTDAQLAAEAKQLDARATAIGEQLLAADARRDVISQDRDLAAALLAGFLADAYKTATTTGSTTQQLLVSGSFAEAIDRLQVASTVGRYRRSVLRDLDESEARLDVAQVDHARLVTELTAAQRRLVVVQQEQARRAQIVAAQQAERRAKQQAAAAKAARDAQAATVAAAAVAAQTAGTLVGSSSSAPAAVGPVTPFAPPGTPPTAQLLDAYLASKGSPMAGQGAAFMESGARWRVDPRLLVAIAGAESSFGATTCGPNNAWGWACPNDPADFQTWADGIDTVTSGLRRYYLDEGRTSVSLIQQKYCPVGAANDPTGLNSHWNTNVTKFLLELGGNPASVGPGPSSPSALGIPGFGIFGD